MALFTSRALQLQYVAHRKSALFEGDNMVTRQVLLCAIALAGSPAPKLVVDVTGTWRVTIAAGHDTITGMAALKQNGDVVSGWVGPNELDPIPIAGFLTADRLTLKTFPQPGRTVAFDRCDLTVNSSRMVGTIEGGDTHSGTITFERTSR